MNTTQVVSTRRCIRRRGRWSAGAVALLALGATFSCQGPEDGKAPHQPIRGVDTPREESSQQEEVGPAALVGPTWGRRG